MAISAMLFGLAFAFSRGEDVPKLSKVEFSASPCFGVCPSYTVTFLSDGSARLVWHPPHRDILARRDSFFASIVPQNLNEDVLRSNDDLVFEGKISTKEFKQLCRMLDEDNFFIAADYQERVTDIPTYTLSAESSDGKTHTVRIRGIHIPDKMRRWREKIRELTHKVKWHYVGPQKR